MKKNNKGFTLAELLIVVAIIAVLVAIAIPIFTAQLEKAREATDLANLRGAYAEQMAALLSWDGTDANLPEDIKVTAQQTQENWQSYADAAQANIGNATYGNVPVDVVTKGGTWTVSVADDGSAVIITPPGASSSGGGTTP